MFQLLRATIESEGPAKWETDCEIILRGARTTIHDHRVGTGTTHLVKMGDRISASPFKTFQAATAFSTKQRRVTLV